MCLGTGEGRNEFLPFLPLIWQSVIAKLTRIACRSSSYKQYQFMQKLFQELEFEYLMHFLFLSAFLMKDFLYLSVF